MLSTKGLSHFLLTAGMSSCGMAEGFIPKPLRTAFKYACHLFCNLSLSWIARQWYAHSRAVSKQTRKVAATTGPQREHISASFQSIGFLLSPLVSPSLGVFPNSCCPPSFFLSMCAGKGVPRIFTLASTSPHYSFLKGKDALQRNHAPLPTPTSSLAFPHNPEKIDLFFF